MEEIEIETELKGIADSKGRSRTGEEVEGCYHSGAISRYNPDLKIGGNRRTLRIGRHERMSQENRLEDGL